MKKFLTSLLALGFFCALGFAEEAELEQPFQSDTAYTVDITRTSPKTPFALHVNFKKEPEPEDARKTVLEELKTISADNLYSGENIIIIATAWYPGEDGENVKINFTERFGAYVWVAKEKKIMQFPDYLKWLKKEKEEKDKKDKEKKKEKEKSAAK
jgi:hypothetical protein